MSKHSLFSKLKVQALICAPFFATFFFRIPILEDSSCETAYTDGKQIGFNPSFMNSLPIKQAMTVWVHEVLHLAFLHHLRKGSRELKRWNYACDLAINLLLVEMRYSLPDCALLDYQYKGLSAEQIYELLPEKVSFSFVGLSVSCEGGKSTKQITDENGIKPLLLGEIIPVSFSSQANKDEYISDLKGLIAEAVQTAKVQGKLPAAFDRLLDTLDKATMDWKEVLASFLMDQYKSGSSLERPNKRFLSRSILLPGKQIQKRGRFILAVDTSASITSERLKEVSAEVMDILTLSSDVLHVLYFDSAVTSTQALEEGNLDNLTPQGGGGTDFKPVVEYIEKEIEDPQVLIYFTDGHCNSFAHEPEFSVLWITDNLNFFPPYGETVFMQHAA